MLRIPLTAAAALFMVPSAFADPKERPTAYDEIISRQAKAHGVPESLVHRTVLRESRYNPGLVHNHCFGLMQIKYATARSMGYEGPARGLLDPQVNLTYAIPYLANAYRLAEGDEDRATLLYRGGYYYFAKRKKMQGLLRTASSPAPVPETAQSQAPEPPRDGFSELLSFAVGPVDAARPVGAPSQTAEGSSQTAEGSSQTGQ
ncbi:MAG TPA: lytic transglycosylase domain-containing protein [Methylocella sp.]|nr:lytic transglycosylase domain-containing protein [Methylocella sp.]